MHVGKHKNECKVLKVHEKNFINVDEITILGDIISSDRKNTKNITNRTSKGIGIINDIMDILNNISFGPYYFEIAIMLRNAYLINGMLYNLEIAYSMNKSDYKELSKVDFTLPCNILNAPKTIQKEAPYLELGIEDVETILMKRRILYFKDMISRGRNDMVEKFITVQWLRVEEISRKI